MDRNREKGELLRSNAPAGARGRPDRSPPANIQEDFLNRMRKDRVLVSVLLTTGVKLSGRIRSFDKYSLILEVEGQEQLLFKHAIATVEAGQTARGGASDR